MRCFIALLVAVCCSGCGGCAGGSSGGPSASSSPTSSPTIEPIVPGVAVGQEQPRVMRINPALFGVHADGAAPAPSSSVAPPAPQQ